MNGRKVSRTKVLKLGGRAHNTEMSTSQGKGNTGKQKLVPGG